jgi:Bacterial Ig-like domain/PKD domain
METEAAIEGGMLVRGSGTKSMVRLTQALVAALLVLALGPLVDASAAGPAVTIATPPHGVSIDESAPLLAGQTSDEAAVDVVTVRIYEGAGTAGALVETLESGAPSGGAWSAKSAALADGVYTAVAQQLDSETLETGVSEETTFTIDTRPPDVTLTPLASLLNNPKPSFGGDAGTAPGDIASVALTIYAGTAAAGSPVETIKTTPSGASWAATPAKALAEGTYTAVATQLDEANNEGLSIARTFTVDTRPPTLTLTAPSTSSGIETVSGVAGDEPGDRRQVTVELFAGASVEPGNAVEMITVNASGAAWSATFAGLAPGSYTVIARQSDEAGNVGESAPSAFTVSAAPVSQPASSPITSAASPPSASFTWVPSSPTVGQSVSLVSDSTNGSSTIGAYAWDLAGDGQFAPGGAVMTTSFATVGAHLVQLQVTDADGLSSTIAQTITVTAASPRLMQPFPIVRIAGSETSYGAKVKLLTVQAPIGAKVQVTCVGHGCTTKPESRVAAASSKATVPAGAVSLAFKRFERPLRAGVTLQIRVTQAGEIGKYTSFAIRRNKLPVRTDACLQPTSSKPSACPSS